MDEPLQEDTSEKKNDDSDTLSEEDLIDKPIATWTYCMHCKKVVAPLTFISDNTWVCPHAIGYLRGLSRLLYRNSRLASFWRCSSTTDTLS